MEKMGKCYELMYLKEILDSQREQRELGSKNTNQIWFIVGQKKGHLANHCWSQKHLMDWENTSVIDEDKNWQNRLIKESICFIRTVYQ